MQESEDPYRNDKLSGVVVVNLTSQLTSGVVQTLSCIPAPRTSGVMNTLRCLHKLDSITAVK
jgi:hypothetical protein